MGIIIYLNCLYSIKNKAIILMNLNDIYLVIFNRKLKFIVNCKYKGFIIFLIYPIIRTFPILSSKSSKNISKFIFNNNNIRSFIITASMEISCTPSVLTCSKYQFKLNLPSNIKPLFNKLFVLTL
jgi:hypothetical protein